MKFPFLSSGPSTKVHLAIGSDVLTTLINNGQLHAADFNCLNLSSKKTVWEILLTAATPKKDKE
jgi:hypothetical protein